MTLDFNDTTPRPESNRRTIGDAEREELRADLLARLESVLITLFPAGKKRRGKFLIGDVLGSPGDSLEVVLAGDKQGLWTDRATGDGGDIYALIGGHFGIDVSHDFPRVLDAAADLLGRSRSTPLRKSGKKGAPVDELGPATAKWDYLDATGKLIAVVYRYDPPGQKKQFRPWDAKRRKVAPPDPRPLYNQPGMTDAALVVLVEGEKCAQALIDTGIVATTAMHGANAPVDKTDWSPLAGKAVLIWPDRDKPGWEYATQAAQAILSAGAKSCHILYPPEEATEGWDAADAIAEGFDVSTFLTHGPRLQMHDVTDVDDPVVGSDESVWGTEDALALAFTRRYHRDWRYVAGWGRWLVWDGHRWRTEDTLAATDLIRSVCRQTAVRADNPKIAAKLASAGTVSGVERLARADRRHAATTDEWDADPWLLNTPGGVVDLKSGRQRPHERADRMTKITTAAPKGGCPTWLQFIDEVTGGDKALQAYLQRMVGYALTGSTQEHALFFLYGTGANGKSVFVNTLATILGDYATNAPMDTFMETRTDRHPTDMAGLRGARFVAAIETEQGRRWAESKVKNLTGGDKISARFMRQDFFEFFPQFKLFVAGNHKPAIRNIDEAMKRRLHLIPFTIIHFGCIDELHAHKTRTVYDVVETGTGKRDNSLLWVITTAGSNRSGICYEVRTFVTRLLDGVFEDDSQFGIVYGLDDGDDWTLEESLIKANPNWGISVRPEVLAPLQAKAMQMPSAVNNFKTKHLNEWVNADTAWMDGRYIIADMKREQFETNLRDQLIKNTAVSDGRLLKQSLPQDPGQAGKSQVLAFAKLLAGHNVHFSPESGDKVTRATPLASQINAGNVLLLKGTWNTPFIDECRLFPFGKYDDQVDGAARGFNGLLQPTMGIFT